MSKLLASVNSIEEVLMVLDMADIIDLKQPKQGALGALELPFITGIVQAIRGRYPISATIGDLPMQADIIVAAVQAMTETRVNYIKIGFFPEGDWHACVEALKPLAQQHSLIAVLFADMPLNFEFIHVLAAAGFHGVMLDTMHKQNGSLTQQLTINKLEQFVKLAQSQQLLCGLAGSLQQQDIAALLPLHADYLGFRGALCQQHQRTASLDPEAINEIYSTIKLTLSGLISEENTFFDAKIS